MSGSGVRVLFLGKLRDLAGMDECTLPAPLGWSGLLAAVSPVVATELRGERVQIACGAHLLADRKALNAGEGDEVALLPPVSGG
jgi:molybdopterin synthase sulfur carrier subunit